MEDLLRAFFLIAVFIVVSRMLTRPDRTQR